MDKREFNIFVSDIDAFDYIFMPVDVADAISRCGTERREQNVQRIIEISQVGKTRIFCQVPLHFFLPEYTASGDNYYQRKSDEKRKICSVNLNNRLIFFNFS